MGHQSRFANLYKDIHSVSNQENEENINIKMEEKEKNVNSNNKSRSSKFSNLMGSIDSNSNKDSIEDWKSFTEDLMGSNHGKIEKDEIGDDLLSDLFGDKHRNDEEQKDESLSFQTDEKEENQTMSSRASKLMSSIPELIATLTETQNEENDENED